MTDHSVCTTMNSLGLCLLFGLALVCRVMCADRITPAIINSRVPAQTSVPAPELCVVHAVSDDGRWILLSSSSDRIVLHDHNSAMDLFLLDCVMGKTVLVSTLPNGQSANDTSIPGGMSSDGLKVVFQSRASDLVSGDSNRTWDVFAVDLRGKVHRMICYPDYSTGPAGSIAYVSPCGCYVVFEADDMGAYGVVLADLQTTAYSSPLRTRFSGEANCVFSNDGTRFACTLDSGSGLPYAHFLDVEPWASGRNPILFKAPQNSRGAAISADGKHGAYWYRSSSSTAVLMVTDFTEAIPVFTNIALRVYGSRIGLSADGRFMVWTSPTSTTNINQVLLCNLNRGAIELISVSHDGQGEANGDCEHAAISRDGRYVAFASLADNLVHNDTNSRKDVFLRDTAKGQTLLVSRTPFGTSGAGWSSKPFFSADGRCLFFLSQASDLDQDDCNQQVDLFKIEILDDSVFLIVIQRDIGTGQIQLLWEGTPSKTYGVEFTDNLAGEWARLPGEFHGTAPINQLMAAHSCGFFRIIELP